MSPSDDPQKEAAAKEKEQAELKQALDVSSANNRNLLIFFLAFMIYMTLVIFQTTDLMLLLPIFGIKLPILGVEVPVLGFYFIAPPLIFLMHFNLLLNLQEHRIKFNAWMPAEDGKGTQEAKTKKLYPFLYNLKEGNNQLMLRLIIRIVYYIFPTLLLFGVFARVYCYQNVALSLWHLAFLLVCLVLYWYFPISALFQPQEEDAAQAERAQRKFIRWIRWVSFGLLLFFLFLRLEAEPFPTFRKLVLLEAPIDRLNTPNLNFPSLFEAHKVKLLAEGKEKFSLKGRNLRHINLENSVFCTTNKVASEDGKEKEKHECLVLFDEDTDLSHAELSWVQLHGAGLVGTTLQGANLKFANLQGAYLWGANLQGATLTAAWLSSFDFNADRLESNRQEMYQKYKKSKPFLCLDYLTVEQALYHRWRAEDPEKAEALKVELQEAQCPSATMEFLETKPEDWDYQNMEHHETRWDLVEKIKKQLYKQKKKNPSPPPKNN